MRPAGSLDKLSKMAIGRVRRLRTLAIGAMVAGLALPDRDKVIGYVVVELQNVWANFVRSYLLSFIKAPKRRLGGRVVLGNKSVNCPGVLLHEVAKAVKGPVAPAPTSRREEPRWHDTSVFTRACRVLKPSNENDIYAALSLPSYRAFSDLPVFRNFYAHRNEESAQKAVKIASRYYLIVGQHHPTDALVRHAYGRPQALLLDWLDEMETVMELLCD